MRSLVSAACLLVATTALADGSSESTPDPGLTLTVGGGIFGFTHEEARRVTDTVGPQVELGLLLGSRRHLGLEVGYAGMGQDLKIPGIEDASFFAHGLEGLVHFTFLSHTVRPFLFAGAAAKVYVLEPSDSPRLVPHDTVLEIPVGAGVAFHVSYFVVDLRGAYRFAFDEGLGGRAFDPELDTWSSTLRVGFEL
jgi:hypothetical protein